jgi:biopolymer transport protein ExbD
MSYLRKLGSAEVSTSSMADIAFLLLTFFLMTTVIKNEKGLMLMLPQWSDIQITSDINERNIFSVQINAENNFLVEGERRTSLSGVKDEIKKFILNDGAVNTLSENPVKAIVSLKTDRSTSHEAFIASLDEIQGAYFEIYAERARMSVKDFRELDLNDQHEKKIYDKAREGIPMNISVAEPTHLQNH